MAQNGSTFTILSDHVSFADSANLDAFSKLRVSSAYSLLSVQSQYNTQPFLMEYGATGTGVAGVFSTNTRMVAISCTAGTGTSFGQSYQYAPYQPGRSTFVAITGLLDAAVANAVVDVGFFDLLNGIIYRQNGTSGLQFIRRTSTSGSVVDNTVNQSAWNLDKLDGTGASGITLDASKVFILIIDLQFLGMGRIRVGFDIGGVIVYAHEFLNANIITVPYMQQATLPMQMLITATATGSTKTCYFKCCCVDSEGGISDDVLLPFSTPEVTMTAGNGTRTHVVSIRPKTTFNGLPNRTTFAIDSINILVTGTNPVLIELCMGQAITGASYADINTSHSAFEYGTGTISGSPIAVIGSTYSSGAGGGSNPPQSITRSLINKYPITLDRAGAVRANGTISIVATGIGGTSAMRCVVNTKEVR
jgi:hypothetical protein